MKKILFTLAFLMITGSAYAVSYYDAQHFEVVPDTPNVRNDWYFRGGFHIVKSTSEAKASECPVVMSFNDDGTFTVTVSSATWADNSDLLDGYNYDYFASTAALQAEITARINADSLLGSATNQIRIDFEAYDAELNTSTSTLRTDLTTEISNRINGDNLLGLATGQLRLDLINEISSLTTTYLGLTAKAADSNLLDGYNYDHFVDTVTNQTIAGYKIFSNNVNISSLTINSAFTFPISDGTSNQILKTDGFGNITWGDDLAGGGGFEVKEDNVQISSPTISIDFLNYFNINESPAGEANVELDTTTLATNVFVALTGNQTISGDKTFSNFTQFSSSITVTGDINASEHEIVGSTISINNALKTNGNVLENKTDTPPFWNVYSPVDPPDTWTTADFTSYTSENARIAICLVQYRNPTAGEYCYFRCYGSTNTYTAINSTVSSINQVAQIFFPLDEEQRFQYMETAPNGVLYLRIVDYIE